MLLLLGPSPLATEDSEGVPANCPSLMVLVHPEVVNRFARHGSIGVGEAYMEQQWVPEPNTPDGLKAVLVSSARGTRAQGGGGGGGGSGERGRAAGERGDLASAAGAWVGTLWRPRKRTRQGRGQGGGGVWRARQGRGWRGKVWRAARRRQGGRLRWRARRGRGQGGGPASTAAVLVRGEGSASAARPWAGGEVRRARQRCWEGVKVWRAQHGRGQGGRSGERDQGAGKGEGLASAAGPRAGILWRPRWRTRQRRWQRGVLSIADYLMTYQTDPPRRQFQMSLFYEDLERRSKTWASVSLLAASYFSNRAVKKSAELQRIHYDLGNEL